MAIPEVINYHIAPFWDQEFYNLDYENETFNDPVNLDRWLALGFPNRFTGDMCDMRSPQPSWNNKFVNFFRGLGWKNIGTSYYRMQPGTVLPNHRDLYVKYVRLFDLVGREHTIHRAVIFLENWQPGHYAEYAGKPFVQWHAGDTVEWVYDTEHMAANMGVVPRYTLQVTGHI